MQFKLSNCYIYRESILCNRRFRNIYGVTADTVQGIQINLTAGLYGKTAWYKICNYLLVQDYCGGFIKNWLRTEGNCGSMSKESV